MGGSGRVKALQVLKKDGFSFTINGGDGTDSDTTVGTILASNQGNSSYERFFTTYTNFTLNNVKLDANRLGGQIDGEDCAVICHSYGDLVLKGNTSILTKGGNTSGNYYAIAGRFTDNYGSGGFSITINTTSDEPLEYVGLYKGTNRGGGAVTAWSTATTELNSSSIATGPQLVIQQGNVGTITYGDKVRASSGGAVAGTTGVTYLEPDDTLNSHITISKGATLTNLPEAYSMVNDAFLANANGKYYATDEDGWYGSTNNWSYVSKNSVDESTKVAVALASLTGANTTLTLADASLISGGIGFNAADSVNFGSNISRFKTFEVASDFHSAVSVTGNDYLTKITGGGQADSLTAGVAKVTLAGGAGANTLDGASKGENTFVFSGGTDVIKGRVDSDYISLDGIEAILDGSKISTQDDGFKIDFGDNGTLTFAEGTEAKVRSDGQIYTYAQNFIGLGKSLTLAAGATGYTLDSANNYNAIDAAAAGNASLIGNAYANTLKAGTSSTLDGGLGNDNLYGGGGADLFIYGDRGGKDSIYDYAAGDLVSLDATKIASGTINNNDDLVFKIDNSNSLTFKAAENGTTVTKVQLAGGAGALTKDGVIGSNNILKVFSTQKGTVDLTDTLYSGVTGIDASGVTKNAVTMKGGTAGGTFTFAANKKADVFEYGGGSVVLNSYETDTDKIDLDKFALSSFNVNDGTGAVTLNVGSNAIVLSGSIKDNEVLLHDSTSKNNSFKTMVFHADGVLYDKKKATSATLSSGLTSTYTADPSIKKITVGNGVTGISVQAGNRNNTTFDASNAGTGVTLVGGTHNDKFTGKDKNVDTFAFNANMGKDVITNYESTDKIVLDGAYSLGAAKITQSKKSVTLKFDNKNSLTIKGEDSIGAININSASYNFGKNAVITGATGSQKASLTEEFSGTYKVASGITEVDGSAIKKKNYTLQGTSTGETLTAGGSSSGNGANRKVTFKGGGGADSLVGGTSKDTFFYARNDTGATTVDYFSYANDNLKIKRTITKIEKTGDGLVFEMGSTDNKLTLQTDDKNNNVGSSNFLIKANNTLYWFDGSDLCTAKGKESKDAIKEVLRSKSDYAIVDLNYSTNLVKAKVAKDDTGVTFTSAMADAYKIK